MGELIKVKGICPICEKEHEDLVLVSLHFVCCQTGEHFDHIYGKESDLLRAVGQSICIKEKQRADPAEAKLKAVVEVLRSAKKIAEKTSKDGEVDSITKLVAIQTKEMLEGFLAIAEGKE